MSILASVQRVNIPTGVTTTIQVRDAATFGGETPKAAIVIVAESGTAFTKNDDARMSIGFAAGAAKTFSTFMSEDAQTNMDSYKQNSFLALWQVLDGSGTAVSNGGNTFAVNGIDLEPAANPTVSCEAIVYLLGGDGIADAAVVAKSMNGESTPIDITTFGFQPDLVFAHGTTGSGISINDGGVLGFGVAGRHQGGSIAQWSTAILTQDNIGTANVRSIHSDSTLLSLPQPSSSTLANDLTLSKFIDDGIQCTFTQVGNFINYFLGLKLTNARNIHIETIDIDASNTSFTSSAALQAPVFGLSVFADDSGTLDSVATSGTGSFAINAYDGTNTEGAAFYDRDVQTTSDTGSIFCSGAWGHINRVGTTITQMSYAFNGSDQTVLTETSNSLSQDGHMGIFMLGADQSAITLGTTDVVDVLLGTTSILSQFNGSSELP